jgi:hypothetical protein
MRDSNNLYGQMPEIFSDSSGLVIMLTDINGNEFMPEDRRVGSELSIDYPSKNIFDLQVVDYIVCENDSGKRYWKEVKRRQWVPDEKTGLTGSWREGWVEIP